jgi:Sigma-54 interaction domain
MEMVGNEQHTGLGALMMARDYFDFEFSEPNLQQWLSSVDRTPNLLIQCARGAEEKVMGRVTSLLPHPFQVCDLPGPLRLPLDGQGTLILNDVADLNLGQQIVLHDWMTQYPGRVVSITSSYLPALVQDGRFLESLYYRLNIVWVDARQKRSGVPMWEPRPIMQ